MSKAYSKPCPNDARRWVRGKGPGSAWQMLSLRPWPANKATSTAAPQTLGCTHFRPYARPLLTLRTIIT